MEIGLALHLSQGQKRRLPCQSSAPSLGNMNCINTLPVVETSAASRANIAHDPSHNHPPALHSNTEQPRLLPSQRAAGGSTSLTLPAGMRCACNAHWQHQPVALWSIFRAHQMVLCPSGCCCLVWSPTWSGSTDSMASSSQMGRRQAPVTGWHWPSSFIESWSHGIV